MNYYFNLMIFDEDLGKSYALENAFQAGKVFEQGGPYTDILKKSPLEAKKDPRLQASGELICFRREGIDWPLGTPAREAVC